MHTVFTGVVTRGEGRAARLGFPTINISFAEANIKGIYAARVTARGATYLAAAFADPVRGVLEAHLIDFSENLYGETATIELHKKIRSSDMFTDDAALAQAIAADVEDVRRYFATPQSAE